MTREEAIKRLEWLRMVGNHVDSVTLGKNDMPHFDMAISALREQPRWISVEERLPEEDGFYLVYGPFIYRDTKWYDRKNFSQYFWKHDVTHWMPLPEPPEET